MSAPARRIFWATAIRWLCTFVFTPVVVVSLVAGAADAASPRARHPWAPPPRPPAPLIAGFAAAGISTTGTSPYSIHDVGAPPSTLYHSVPVAFNNSGQILGAGLALSRNTVDCVLYNGSGTYYDVSASANHFNCQPLSLSAKGANGTLYFVGTVNTLTNPNTVAFEGRATTSGGTTGTFAASDDSDLYAVNTYGEAAGGTLDSFFDPSAPDEGEFSSGYAAAYVLGYGKSIVADGSDECYLYLASFCFQGLGSPPPCPFGGCAINDSGTILGYDGVNGEYAEFSASDGFIGDLALNNVVQGTVFLNNTGRVAYESATSSGAVTIVGTTKVPALAGNSCSQYYPISFNNAGAVLGYTAGCHVAHDQVYWTWDAKTGIHNLNAAIPANSYKSVAPLGLNDNGQILVSLTTTSGIVHWGTLNPLSATSFLPAASRGPAHP